MNIFPKVIFMIRLGAGIKKKWDPNVENGPSGNGLGVIDASGRKRFNMEKKNPTIHVIVANKMKELERDLKNSVPLFLIDHLPEGAKISDMNYLGDSIKKIVVDFWKEHLEVSG